MTAVGIPETAVRPLVGEPASTNICPVCQKPVWQEADAVVIRSFWRTRTNKLMALLTKHHRDHFFGIYRDLPGSCPCGSDVPVNPADVRHVEIEDYEAMELRQQLLLHLPSCLEFLKKEACPPRSVSEVPAKPTAPLTGSNGDGTRNSFSVTTEAPTRPLSPADQLFQEARAIASQRGRGDKGQGQGRAVLKFPTKKNHRHTK